MFFGGAAWATLFPIGLPTSTSTRPDRLLPAVAATTTHLSTKTHKRMRQTLRRSCAGCAKSKHSCDLRLPRCSRCVRRKVPCLYANEPWTATAPAATGSGSRSGFGDYQYNNGAASERHLEGPGTLTTGYNRFGSLDPFDSYPPTRLPREHVQRLIHGCTYQLSLS